MTDDAKTVSLLRAAQQGLDTAEHRGKWLMIEGIIRSLVSHNLCENLPITRWGYDSDLGQIHPQIHRLRDLRNQSVIVQSTVEENSRVKYQLNGSAD